MYYQVKKAYARNLSAETLLKAFSDQTEAVEFIQKNLKEDISHNIKAVYRLCEFNECIQEYTQADLEVDSTPASSGQSSSQSFSPTPFSMKMAPRPKGATAMQQRTDEKKDKE